MKKLLFAVAIAVAVMGASCSGKSEQVKVNEQDLKAKIESCTNPDSVKIYVEQAKAYADSLAAAGKTDEAKKYLEGLAPAIDKAAPSLKEQFNSTLKAVEQTAVNAKDSVASATSAAVDSAKSAASQAVSDKANELKDKASDAADKAGDAVNKAADKTKEAAANALDKLKGNDK